MKVTRTERNVNTSMRRYVQKYLLAYRIKSKPKPYPKESMSLYTWEEGIQNNVLDYFTIVDTGVPTLFFSESYIKKLLRKLNNRHRPI